MVIDVYSVITMSQARKVQLNICSSEDNLNVKSGHPQVFVVVLKCILLAGQ